MRELLKQQQLTDEKSLLSVQFNHESPTPKTCKYMHASKDFIPYTLFRAELIDIDIMGSGAI